MTKQDEPIQIDIHKISWLKVYIIGSDQNQTICGIPKSLYKSWTILNNLAWIYKQSCMDLWTTINLIMYVIGFYRRRIRLQDGKEDEDE